MPLPLPGAVSTLAGRDLLRATDLAPVELGGLLDLAAELKAAMRAGQQRQLCAGRTLGMVFEKRSTRTRVSFEVGMAQLGGHALHLSSANELQIGRGETPARHGDGAVALRRRADGSHVRAGRRRRARALRLDTRDQRPDRRRASLPGARRPPDARGALRRSTWSAPRLPGRREQRVPLARRARGDGRLQRGRRHAPGLPPRRCEPRLVEGTGRGCGRVGRRDGYPDAAASGAAAPRARQPRPAPPRCLPATQDQKPREHAAATRGRASRASPPVPPAC